MPSTTTQKIRTKRPDARPNAKHRRKEHKIITEKERLERVAQREAYSRRHNPLTVEHVAVPIQKPEGLRGDNEWRQQNKGRDVVSSRIRALHKVLRQIQVLEEKEKNGVVLDDAQSKKISRFDAVISELEELQTIHDDVEDIENSGGGDDEKQES
jgi:uncharacterized protein with WD repeat